MTRREGPKSGRSLGPQPWPQMQDRLGHLPARPNRAKANDLYGPAGCGPNGLVTQPNGAVVKIERVIIAGMLSDKLS